MGNLAILWLCVLLLSATRCEGLTTGEVFTNNGVSDATFISNVLFKSLARSVLDCCRQCSLDDRCKTFTFSPPTCQGHCIAMTSDSGQTTAFGSKSFVRSGAVTEDRAVRCQQTDGVQLLSVPQLGHLTVFCQDNWIIILRRQDGSVDFYRNWISYQEGFGNVTGEFWLGLEALHQVTSTARYQLVAELWDWEGNFTDAIYTNFSVGPSELAYPLSAEFVGGAANDSLSVHSGQSFTTMDVDNDINPKKNCAVKLHGGWWYAKCASSNLCGRYYNSSYAPIKDGITWKTWLTTAYSLKSVQLKMQPIDNC